MVARAGALGCGIHAKAEAVPAPGLELYPHRVDPGHHHVEVAQRVGLDQSARECRQPRFLVTLPSPKGPYGSDQHISGNVTNDFRD